MPYREVFLTRVSTLISPLLHIIIISVLPLNEANDICRNFDGDEFHFTLCDERDAMLICAYIELIVTLLSILGSFFVSRRWRSHLGLKLALVDIGHGRCYLFIAVLYGWVHKKLKNIYIM